MNDALGLCVLDCTPSPEEIEKITDINTRKYLYSINKKKPQNLQSLFPACDGPALSLLKGLLQFDVTKRITVSECLLHPYFRDVRQSDNETIMLENDAIIALKYFQFEYEVLTLNELKRLILLEAKLYKSSKNIDVDFLLTQWFLWVVVLIY